MSRKLLIALVLVGLCATAAATRARQSSAGSPPQAAPPATQANPQISDQDIDLLRKDLRARKKQLVATNLTLTPQLLWHFAAGRGAQEKTFAELKWTCPAHEGGKSSLLNLRFLFCCSGLVVLRAFSRSPLIVVEPQRERRSRAA